jgi:hypothetical protein
MAKKNSAMKKLVAAAAMLGVSTTMLSGATYAWFTMSREVEVQNIQMTATVPEDLQISVGVITAGKSLNDSDSYVVDATTAPTDPNMWSNTLDVSQYYTMGKIIPASSTTGANIFFTPDATAVGKTVKTDGSGAQYIMAANGLVAQTGSGTYMTTLHANVASDTWLASGYTPASTFNTTNDDGYYVDVPVWLRTSSDDNIALSVSAYTKKQDDTKANSGATVELFKAARVVVLDPTGTTSNTGGSLATSKIIALKADSYTGASVLDYYGREVTDGAVKSAGYYNVDGSGTIYGPIEKYDAGNPVVTVPGSSTNEYGEGKLVYVRVWLEGEDRECWNQNAGQNFSINLMFEKI